MDTITAPAQASYEVAVQREMLKQARRCAQLEMALEAVRAKLAAPGSINASEKNALVARIDSALETTSDQGRAVDRSVADMMGHDPHAPKRCMGDGK